MAGGIEEINALTSCGGCCSCGTCHVYLDLGDLGRVAAMKSDEEQLLQMHEDRRPTSRLSCQVRLTEDLEELTVTIAPEL